MPLTDPDASYAALIAAHDGLSEAESQALNARLILILIDRVGDAAAIAGALRLARETAPK